MKHKIANELTVLSVVFALALSAVGVTPVRAAGILYAKPSASGSGNCLSWENACPLQTALTSAVSGDEIWVMAGTYKPTTAMDRAATFQLKNGVAVYGGFTGTETSRYQRKAAINVTILSGDIDNNDVNTDGDNIAETNADLQGNNSYHVVTGATGATLDGFTITAGHAHGAASDNAGGGVYNKNISTAKYSNLVFSGNHGDTGGGVDNHSSNNITFSNVAFVGNHAGYGGGMFIWTSNSIVIMMATFSGNTATLGGGMYNDWSSPQLYNTIFANNTALLSGGGLYNNNTSSPWISNATFTNNSAGQGGGLYNLSKSNPNLQNVTISYNHAGDSGGGIYNHHSGGYLKHLTIAYNDAVNFGGGVYNDGSNANVRNSIIWGNTAGQGDAQLSFNPFAPDWMFIYNTVIQDGCPFTPWLLCPSINVNDPLLGSQGDYGGYVPTIPLKSGSSAIELSSVSCSESDARGMPRPTGLCDAGAFEVTAFRFYVKPQSSGNGNCLSWANACTLQTAMTYVSSGGEVWVAAGVYRPTTGTDRSISFRLKDGIKVYGGFTGVETALNQRNPELFDDTILSGDIDDNDHNTDGNFIAETYADIVGNNSQHVVIGANNSTIDGFAITAGNAEFLYGGGMWNAGTSPTIKNIIFSGNQASNGGGLANGNSSTIITNVTFQGNRATSEGGGVYNYYNNPPFYNNGAPIISIATFIDNVATLGGGMANVYSGTSIINATFTGNVASQKGGGMYNYTNDYGSPPPQIVNSTFTGNSAESGGGVYNNAISKMKNVIIANSTGGDCATNIGQNPYYYSNNLIESDSSLSSTLSSCGLTNGINGNIIGVDPVLGTLGNYGGFTPTIPLLSGSSAIDAGDDRTCSSIDQRGVVRPQGSHCDIGAVEMLPMGELVPDPGYESDLILLWITGAATTLPNNNGWYNTDVTVHFTADDAQSGLATITPDQTLTGEGAGQFVIGTAVDLAGNSAFATVGPINIDKTPPTISGAATTLPNSNGWYNADATIHFAAEDALSGLDSLTPDQTLATEGAGQSVIGTAVDLAGNSTSVTVEPINIDKTPPTISGAVTTLPNSNGWYNTDVTVRFDAEDMLSGLDTLTPDQTLATEGVGLSIIGTAVDLAGNSTSVTVEPINIDKTPPVVNVWVDKESYTKTEMFIVHFNGVDELSGLNSLTAEFNGQAVTDGQEIELFWLPLGTHTLIVRAEDLAGNVIEVSQSIELTATLENLKETLTRLCSEGYITKNGTCNELSAKLDAAIAAHDRGNDKAAANILQAFQNAVKAQTGKSIQEEAANLLLLDSTYLLENLNP